MADIIVTQEQLDEMHQWKAQLDNLKLAVRELSDNPELLRMVGPSDEEQAAAERRIKHLDALDKSCNWGKVTPPNWQEEQARKKWYEIMDVQGEFERRYC